MAKCNHNHNVKNHLTLHTLKGVKPSDFFPSRTAITATHCSICSKKLTKAESISHMIGPVCRANYITSGFTPIADHLKPQALSNFWGYLALANLDKDLNDYLLANEKDFAQLADILIAYCSIITHQPGGHSKILVVASALRCLGYNLVADRLEEDRCIVKLREMPIGNGYNHTGTDEWKLSIPTKNMNEVKAELNKFVGSSLVSFRQPNTTRRGAFFTVPQSKSTEMLYALAKCFEGERFFQEGQLTVQTVPARSTYGGSVIPCAEFMKSYTPLVSIEQHNDVIVVSCNGTPWGDKRIGDIQTLIRSFSVKWLSGYRMQVDHSHKAVIEAKALSLFEGWEVSVKVVTPFTPKPVQQPVQQTPPVATVSPTKVGSAWGVWVQNPSAVKVGDIVTVATRSGKSWLAKITGATKHKNKFLTAKP